MYRVLTHTECLDTCPNVHADKMGVCVWGGGGGDGQAITLYYAVAFIVHTIQQTSLGLCIQ